MFKEYLGDGVYAEFDGYYILLKAPTSFAEMVIALEPEVFDRLVEYVKGVQTKLREQANVQR